MNEGPGEPGQKAMDLHFAALQDAIPFADHRHGAFVEIAKRFWRLLAGKFAANHPILVTPIHLRLAVRAEKSIPAANVAAR